MNRIYNIVYVRRVFNEKSLVSGAFSFQTFTFRYLSEAFELQKWREMALFEVYYTVVSGAEQAGAQSRQSTKLSLQSSELGLPHPLARRRVCIPPPLWFGVKHTRLLERVWVGPHSSEGTDTVIL